MDDHANLMVLESLLFILILLGATLSVTLLAGPPVPTSRSWTAFDAATVDALDVLLASDGGAALVDDAMARALACAGCDDEATDALAARLASYLPPGAGASLATGNGVGMRRLHAAPPANIPTAEASRWHAPAWPTVLAVTGLSCYDVSMDVDVTVAASLHGRADRAHQVNLHAGGTTHNATREDNLWHVRLPAASRAPTLDTRAAFPAHDANASQLLSTCALGAAGPLLQDALAHASLAATGGPAAPGGTLRLAYDLAPLLAATGADLAGVSLDVHAPAGTGGEPVRLARLDAPALPQGTLAWPVPHEAPLGDHVMILRARLANASSGLDVEARLVAHAQVAMENGVVPIVPMYRVSLLAWRWEDAR